jgi:hypothetical protein
MIHVTRLTSPDNLAHPRRLVTAVELVSAVALTSVSPSNRRKRHLQLAKTRSTSSP